MDLFEMILGGRIYGRRLKNNLLNPIDELRF